MRTVAMSLSARAAGYTQIGARVSNFFNRPENHVHIRNNALRSNGFSAIAERAAEAWPGAARKKIALLQHLDPKLRVMQLR